MRNHTHTPELEGTLTAYHFPESSIEVWLGDKDEPDMQTGFASFGNAFYEFEDGFTVVYTEHLGYFVFSTLVVVIIRGQKGPEQLTQPVQDMLDTPIVPLNNPLDTDL